MLLTPPLFTVHEMERLQPAAPRQALLGPGAGPPWAERGVGAAGAGMANLAEVAAGEQHTRSTLQLQNHFNIFPELLVNINKNINY